jgi:hypothetical protein
VRAKNNLVFYFKLVFNKRNKSFLLITKLVGARGEEGGEGKLHLYVHVLLPLGGGCVKHKRLMLE